MRPAQDDWVQRWNAERIVVGVEQVLRRWGQDPRRAPGELDALLRKAGPRHLVFLESAYRGRRRTLAPILGTDVETLSAGFGRHAAAVAALLTFDRSGYLRETGTGWLAGCDETFALPFLLLRLNDPVEPVRQAAAATVSRRLHVGDADLLVQFLPLLEKLGARQRAGPLARSIGELLVSGGPLGRAALWAGARGDDPAVRASCLRSLATFDPAGAVTHAVSTGEPVLRRWAAGVATAPGLDATVQLRLLPLLVADPDPGIRRRALRARTRHPGSEPFLRHALLDPDARVRHLARTGLRAPDHTGSAIDLYRATLADRAAGSGALVGALAGLADMGERTDVATVSAYLVHPHVRVRAEAWRALAALDPDTCHARADELRAEPSSKVRRQLPSGVSAAPSGTG